MMTKLSNKLLKFKYFYCKMEQINYSTTSLTNYNLIKPQINETISLTEHEKEIFNIIKKVLHKHNKITVCRVAGGWVRDKVFNFIKN